MSKLWRLQHSLPNELGARRRLETRRGAPLAGGTPRELILMDSLPDSKGFSTPDIAERLRLAAVALNAEEFAEFLQQIAAKTAEEIAA